MKKKLILFPVLFCLLLLTGCNKSTEVENGYTSYYITIANDSSYEVTQIEIFMEGALEIHQISELNPGEFSQKFEFQLPDRPNPAPISYGDYKGSYLQNGIENYIFIPIPETNILVQINDDGYTVEDGEN